MELEQLRNAALSGSETYHAKSAIAAQFCINTEVKKIIDSMPVMTTKIAEKLAQRVLEKVRQASSVSIWGKIQSQEHQSTAEMIEYAKTQKKDSFYDPVAPIFTISLA